MRAHCVIDRVGRVCTGYDVLTVSILLWPLVPFSFSKKRVSLELLEDGTPKPPKDSIDDGLPKLYVNHNGFMKVLGCTLDVDIEKMKPILYDAAGNVKDPNIT